MKRDEWLLLYLATPVNGETPRLDPVRIMKGMFLLTREEPSLKKLYGFEPYHYGPFSVDVYRDLDLLVAKGEVQAEKAAGYSWLLYSPTQAGFDRASKVRMKAPSGIAEHIEQVKKLVCSLRFADLLREVYRRYPEYAVQTALPHLKSK